jgi:hypothetical protein
MSPVTKDMIVSAAKSVPLAASLLPSDVINRLPNRRLDRHYLSGEKKTCTWRECVPEKSGSTIVRPSNGDTRIKPGRPPRILVSKCKGFCISISGAYDAPRKTVSAPWIYVTTSPGRDARRSNSLRRTLGAVFGWGTRSRKVRYFGQRLIMK